MIVNDELAAALACNLVLVFSLLVLAALFLGRRGE